MLKRLALSIWALLAVAPAFAQSALPNVADIPTRPGVHVRVEITPPPGDARGILVLFAGGNGILAIAPDGSLTSGRGNFLIRTRAAFAKAGFWTVAFDAPSDRQTAPYLGGVRQTDAHVADIKATMAWLRARAPNLPVWLVGTSRGTQSVAYVATQMRRTEGGADGIVLTSTIFSDDRSRAVPATALDRIDVPTLFVHHRRDACRLCDFATAESTLARVSSAPRKKLIAMDGGITQGDPCEAFAYHGFNGIEAQTIAAIVDWIGG
jgi:alpha/beta superfamily hydrolase